MPEAGIEGFEDLAQFAIEDLVEPVVAAAFATEDEIRVVQRFAVDELVGLGLGGDALELVALRSAPVTAGKDLLQGVVDPLGVG